MKKEEKMAEREREEEVEIKDRERDVKIKERVHKKKWGTGQGRMGYRKSGGSSSFCSGNWN